MMKAKETCLLYNIDNFICFVLDKIRQTFVEDNHYFNKKEVIS